MAKDGKERCDGRDTAIRSHVVSQKMLYIDQRKTKPVEGTLEKLKVACKIGVESIE